MTDRSMKEVLEILARDVGELADFARNLEHTVFASTIVETSQGDIENLQTFDGLIQHLDDMKALLFSIARMTDPGVSLNAEVLAKVAKLGHYQRIFGLPQPNPDPDPASGHVDLF
ncbi:hypothetical protein [Phaeobacter sp. J2-8]|uniref:hypothetical protein n=1 Tax=Phaeobacter sp. J2-8 TaxID=2931394 RepID=UPI001FD5C841|nr:hypothetical protein [Phaeobacter sp. J2-8]MCJ7872004.1 hypothetical protein [Phaeobacter sp. J2-8]